MKKIFRKSAVLLLIMCICLSLCMSMNLSFAFAQTSNDTAVNIRETDVSQARDGCVLVRINGRFSYVSKNTILARINEIRLEACNEGICGLTPDDYVPIRWSSDLEWIAQTRAAEAVLCKDHTRPNGEAFYIPAHNGVTSDGEVLAWNYSWNSQGSKRMANIMGGIEQWYEEKEDLLNNTGRETGHYLMMIDPANKSIGIGGFVIDGIDMGCVAGEFSADAPQSEAQTGVSGEYDQVVEIEASTLSSIDAADTTVITMGRSLNLNARFISTYLDETCPRDPEYVSCEVVPMDLVWKSEDTSIAEVDSNGVVTGVSPGNTNITASYKSYSYKTYVQVKEYDPREDNTDTDVGDIDGEYSFTGDGDWYGWKSYVDYAGGTGGTISARLYKVTLPKDGRLKVEMTTDIGLFLEAQITSNDGDIIKEWKMGSVDEAIDFCETSDVLQKGTYYVGMGYDLDTRDEYLLYDYLLGKNYFYHRLTFLELTAEEEEQIEIEKMKEKAGKAEDKIDLIPDVSDLTLDDEDTVNAAAAAFNALSDEEKGYVSTGAVNKLNAALDRIRELKETPDDPDDPPVDPDDPPVDPDDPTPDDPDDPDDPPVVDPCAEGHIWGDWATTAAATELSAGVQTRKCSVCGAVETKPVAQLAPTLPAVKIAKPAAAKKSATVKWKKVAKKNFKKVKKIEIQYSLDRNFRTGVMTKYAGAKKTSLKIKGLKSKKTYYVRIRAYTKTGSVVHVSKWSSTKKAKAK